MRRRLPLDTYQFLVMDDTTHKCIPTSASPNRPARSASFTHWLFSTFGCQRSLRLLISSSRASRITTDFGKCSPVHSNTQAPLSTTSVATFAVKKQTCRKIWLHNQKNVFRNGQLTYWLNVKCPVRKYNTVVCRLRSAQTTYTT